MASRRLCTACQRMLRQQLEPHCQVGRGRFLQKLVLTHQKPQILRRTNAPLYPTHRLFSKASAHSATQATATKTKTPAPTTTQSNSDPPSKNVPINPDPASTPSTTDVLAQEFRKRASNMTETYVAYGATEQLVRECARMGQYDIPQIGTKDADNVPKTPEGEDLGVGEGWWYNGTNLAWHLLCSAGGSAKVLTAAP